MIGPRQVYASNDHQQLRDIADARILYYAQRQRLIEDEGWRDLKGLKKTEIGH